MPTIFQLMPIAAVQSLLPQRLGRVPEPTAAMNDAGNIQDFDAIMKTNVSISLCGMIDLVGRIGFTRDTNLAVDLACGPGHFTLMLAQYFDFDKVIGVDLAPGMVQQANANALAAGLADRVTFIQGDATEASGLVDCRADLVTCTNSAHHLPTDDHLARMLSQMDLLVTAQGLGAVMDLTRLKTSWAVERYVQVMGQEYLDRDLNHLYDDFRNSMFAAWTSAELRQACPASADRRWHGFAVRPVPINQFILSLPRGRKPTLGSFEWPTGEPPVPRQYQSDYRQYHAAKIKSFGRLAAT